MPSPTPIGNNYYLRVRVPADVATKVYGKTINVPIDGKPRPVLVRDSVKVSLGTADKREAKRLFTEAHAAVEAYWETVRKGPQMLSQKQLVAVAGEIRNAFVKALDENPGSPERWMRVMDANASARVGRLNPLTIPAKGRVAVDMEARFGGMMDAVLMGRGIMLHPEQRPRLLVLVADALDDAATVNLRKAEGDYSPDTGAAKYPALERTSPSASQSKKRLSIAEGVADAGLWTFEDVITEQERLTGMGLRSRNKASATLTKYRKAIEEFDAHRGNKIVADVTLADGEAWRDAMLTAGKLSRKTVHDKLTAIRALLSWADVQSKSTIFADGSPWRHLDMPIFEKRGGAERTYSLKEARHLLECARKEASSRFRWIPWIAAFTGARVNEITPLEKADVFEVEGRWFIHIRVGEGRTTKTHKSRKVPIHGALKDEGFIDFVRGAPDGRLFTGGVNIDQRIREWVHEKVFPNRSDMPPPNHGFRHLFEDALFSGVEHKAALYITGRSTGSSAEDYGGSDFKLLQLAKQMDKVPSIMSNQGSTATDQIGQHDSPPSCSTG